MATTESTHHADVSTSTRESNTSSILDARRRNDQSTDPKHVMRRGPGWSTLRGEMLGRLTGTEFDDLERIVVMGGTITSYSIAARMGCSQDSAEKRIQRLMRVGLIRNTSNKKTREAAYVMTAPAWTLYREAWAALDASLQEEAA